MPFYTIAQAAEKFGLTTHTLRYYDKEGLLPFVQRSSGGIRLFSDGDLQWLALLTCLKNTGMPLKDIRRFIEWIKQGDESIPQRYEMFLEQKKRLQSEIETMQLYMKRIDFKLWFYGEAMKKGSLAALEQDNAFRKERDKRMKELEQRPVSPVCVKRK